MMPKIWKISCMKNSPFVLEFFVVTYTRNYDMYFLCRIYHPLFFSFGTSFYMIRNLHKSILAGDNKGDACLVHKQMHDENKLPSLGHLSCWRSLQTN